MSLIQNPEQTFRWGRVQCLMDKTTDKQLLLALMGGRATYCCYEYYWTRSKQKAFTDWLEYMEKCIEMANKPYADSIKWGWDNDRMHDEETDDEEEDDELCKNCDSTYTGKKEPFCIMGHKNCDKGLPHITTLHDEDDGIGPMIATADSRAHEIISHRAKYGNAPLFENNIVFGNFFSREQFSEECEHTPGICVWRNNAPYHVSNYFDEFREHIHELGRQGHFNELMHEYFEEWLITNR